MANKKTVIRVCKTCVLPETFPGIHFDEEGVCNYCHEYQRTKNQGRDKKRYQQKFEALIQEYRRKHCYDTLMCFSGGKDSTYTLSILKEKYDLNILAITFDNGFLPPQTHLNITQVVENLGVDHIYFKPRFDLLSDIFKQCSKTDIFAAKTLERASTICTSCMAIIKFTTLRFALEKEIPMISYGWSPGQAPITSAILKNNPKMLKIMQKSVFDSLYRIWGDAIRPYFLEEKHFNKSDLFPYNIHPLAFLDYDEEDIYQKITKLGWEKPQNLDSNSTNCLLNSFANIVHMDRLHFHPYAFELANLVREGYMNRGTALQRLEQEEDNRVVESVARRLGVEPNQ